MSSLIRAVVDTRALRENLGVIRARANGARVMAIVKANAYGHSLVPSALALAGLPLDAEGESGAMPSAGFAPADAFGVARIDEGIALRAAGIRQPIVLLEGVFSEAELREAARHEFELVVHDPSQLDLLEEVDTAHRFTLWLKVDTGMNRLGFRVEDFGWVLERIRELPVRPFDIRLMTHLARADEREAPVVTREQLDRFDALVHGLPFARSICNSAGVLAWGGACGDWVRPGLALYGVSPFAHEPASDFGLRPAMTLETTVIAIRRVPQGEAVGYGGTWRAISDSTIAIVAGGYGDGLPRSLDSGTPVLIEGRRVPLVGRVSMDMIAVNITSARDVKVGARCVLWGDGLGVEEVAEHAGTIPYELLCGVRQRVPYEFI